MSLGPLNLPPLGGVIAPEVTPSTSQRENQSSLTLLLVAIKSVIVNTSLYAANRVFITLEPDPWPSSSGPACAIRPGAHYLIQPQWDGAGQHLAGYSGEVIVRVIDQHEKDLVGHDDYAITLMDVGLGDRALFVVELLTSESAESNFLQAGVVQRGLIPKVIGAPTRRKIKGEDSRWRGIDLTFNVQWTHVYKLS